LDCCC